MSWRATGGEDAYDVIGYLVDENTGYIEEILNETGADAGTSTNWATVSKDIFRARISSYSSPAPGTQPNCRWRPAVRRQHCRFSEQQGSLIG